MKILTLILLALLQLVGILYPYDIDYFLNPIFIFTFIPAVVALIFGLIKQKQWILYIPIYIVGIKMLLMFYDGFNLTLFESILGGVVLLVYINIVNSFEELKIKVKKIRPFLLKLLDFILFISVFIILSMFLIIPMAQSNTMKIWGINEVWILIISMVIFTLLIVLINAILNIKDID